jgi:Spy/CpxP family protein refolding chaperone
MYRVVPAVLIASLTALIACSTAAYGQERPGDKIRDRIETLTMWKMMQELDLNDETSEKILEIRRKFISQRKELRRSLREDFQNLRKYLKEAPTKENDKKLAETIESIRKKRTELRNLFDNQFDDVAKVLPVRKQAELVVFMKDFRREIRSMIRELRRHRRAAFPGRFDRGRGQGRRPGDSSGFRHPGPPPRRPGRQAGPLGSLERPPGQAPPQWDPGNELDDTGVE